MHMYILNSFEINTCIRDHCSKLYSTISLKEFVYIEYILIKFVQIYKSSSINLSINMFFNKNLKEVRVWSNYSSDLAIKILNIVFFATNI